MSEDYAVGYRKPPVHTRFKKGKSGNPTGRPRRRERPLHIESALKNALNSRVTVKENGKVRQITKFDATITQVVNKAASGHLPSVKLLMSFFMSFTEAPSEESYQAVGDPLERIKERLRLLADRKKESELLLEQPQLQTTDSREAGAKK